MTAEPVEYPPHIEPPFYGTGPLMTWEPRVLIDEIDRKTLLLRVRGGEELTETGASLETEQTRIDSALDTLLNDEVLVTLLAPAGLYGYFPVITDDELVIVLDPSDYSTEKAALRFPRMRDKGGRSFADFLRPEGDLLAVQMVTIGGDIDEWVSKRSRGGDSGVPGTVAEYLVDGLEARVTLEITRGLGLPPGTGGSVGFGLPGFPLLQEQQSMYELMAVEERLGVVLSETFQPVPRYSRLGLYVCHSGAKNF